jgi:hypothetical protein
MALEGLVYFAVIQRLLRSGILRNKEPSAQFFQIARGYRSYRLQPSDAYAAWEECGV